MAYGTFASPIGIISIETSARGVQSITLGSHPAVFDDNSKESNEILRRCIAQLKEYFAGDRQRFDLPLDLEGTTFQKPVWSALMQIPHGETRTYGDVASMIGMPGAAQAVGGAVGNNPALIVVPCHRVVAQGGIGGFSAGVHNKETLLAHEKKAYSVG